MASRRVAESSGTKRTGIPYALPHEAAEPPLPIVTDEAQAFADDTASPNFRDTERQDMGMKTPRARSRVTGFEREGTGAKGRSSRRRRRRRYRIVARRLSFYEIIEFIVYITVRRHATVPRIKNVTRIHPPAKSECFFRFINKDIKSYV